MIKSFALRQTEQLFHRQRPPKLPMTLCKIALRKLYMLDAAMRIDDLKIPPGNRLEKLKGSRAGQYSIRINSQWRICFIWLDGNPHDVEIVDYH